MKRHFKLLAVMIAALSAVVALFGCSDLLDGDDPLISTGDILNAEIIESIINAEAVDTTEKYPSETFEDGSLVVYWLKGGSVWHKSLNCSNISESDPANLLTGSISDAFSAGKNRPCKNCSSDITFVTEITSSEITTNTEDQTTEYRYPKEYDETGNLIVYWLDGGNVWHESEKCPVIVNSKSGEIRHGTVYDAYYSKKTRACKQCSADSIVVLTDTTAEEISSTAEVTEARFRKEYDADGGLIVYWLNGGSVWHESKECKTVIGADASELSRGSAETAYYAGKTRACKICSADSEVVIDDFTVTEELTAPPSTEDIKYPKEYSESGELKVFWLEGGSVWHESRNCGTVIKSDVAAICSGSIYDAYYAGKTRACKVCASDSTAFIDKELITTEEFTAATTTAETETEVLPDMVYWVENGGVWHTKRSCSSLSKTDDKDIFCGTIGEAESNGKERACKRCS